MKKSLLKLSLLVCTGVMAQPSPDWITVQNTNFPRPSAGVRYLDAVDANVVWALGYDGVAPNRNYNWYTLSQNGGNTFTSGNVFPDTTTYAMASIEGINATTAWATAYLKTSGNKGGIFKTINGGGTWTNGGVATMFNNAASFANFTCFTNTTTGICLGDPVAGEFEMYRTTNGGTTWTVVAGANIPNPLNASEYALVDVYTKSGSHIWFGTNIGRVLHSSDDGATWTVGAIPGAAQGVSRLAFRDAMNGLAYAYSGTSGAPVFGLSKTTDGGATWTALATEPANMGLNDICAIPNTGYYASCGAGSGNTFLSYSHDDGATWIDWMSFSIQYLKIDFASPTTGWAGTFSDNASASVGGMYKFSGTSMSVKQLSTNGAPLNVYPNPSNGNLSIQLPLAKKGLTIEVIDMFGKIVYTETVTTQTINETKQLYLDFLAKGLYTITLKNENSTSYSKITVQ